MSGLVSLYELAKIAVYIIPVAGGAFVFGRYLLDKDQQLNGVYFERLQTIRSAFRDNHITPIISAMVGQIVDAGAAAASSAGEDYLQSAAGIRISTSFDRAQEDMLRFTRAFDEISTFALAGGMAWLGLCFGLVLVLGVTQVNVPALRIAYYEVIGVVLIYAVYNTVRYYFAVRAFDVIHRQMRMHGD